MLAAASLAQGLRSGGVPKTLEDFRPPHYGLEAGEVCFVDGVQMTIEGMSTEAPLARGLRRVASIKNPGLRRPGPTAPEPGELWVTNWRFILHSLKKGEEELWIQVAYDWITQSWLVDDGFVIFAESVGQPLKLRLPFAAWTFVLYKWLTGGVVIDVELPRSLRGLPLAANLAYPGLPPRVDATTAPHYPDHKVWAAGFASGASLAGLTDLSAAEGVILGRWGTGNDWIELVDPGVTAVVLALGLTRENSKWLVERTLERWPSSVASWVTEGEPPLVSADELVHGRRVFHYDMTASCREAHEHVIVTVTTPNFTAAWHLASMAGPADPSAHQLLAAALYAAGLLGRTTEDVLSWLREYQLPLIHQTYRDHIQQEGKATTPLLEALNELIHGPHPKLSAAVRRASAVLAAVEECEHALQQAYGGVPSLDLLTLGHEPAVLLVSLPRGASDAQRRVASGLVAAVSANAGGERGPGLTVWQDVHAGELLQSLHFGPSIVFQARQEESAFPFAEASSVLVQLPVIDPDSSARVASSLQDPTNCLRPDRTAVLLLNREVDQPALVELADGLHPHALARDNQGSPSP